jgi:hypothetical protein
MSDSLIRMIKFKNEVKEGSHRHCDLFIFL